MRVKQLAIFLLGFVCGMAVLALGLWIGGGFERPVSAMASPAAVTAPAPAAFAPEDPSTARIGVSHGAALAMPITGVDPAKLTSNFEQMRGGHRHEALDIMAPRGTPVHAVDDGVVAKLFTSKPGGLTVYQFNEAQTLCYYYAHLDHYAEGLREGMRLYRGEVVGYVGSTGDASPDAPHLHLAVMELGPEHQWWKGTAIDPLPLLQGRP